MENNDAQRRKINKNNEDVPTEVIEEQATETISLLPSSVTSTGVANNGFIQTETFTSMVISGNNNTMNFKQSASSNPSPDKRIEFNVQDPVQKFIGREEFLKTLHENISTSQLNKNSKIRSKLVVICGMAGVGKTQVARKYIHTYKELYHHVIWINAERKSEANNCFLRLAAKISQDLNNDGKQKAEEDILDEVYDFICKKCVLIIYDNAGYYSTKDGKDGLESILPLTVKTEWMVPSIIVTTRNRDWPDFMVQNLESFELRTGMSFLADSKIKGNKENLKVLEKIVELCQGLPLALQQILNYAHRKMKICEALDESYTFSEFLSEVQLNRQQFFLTEKADSEHIDVYTLFNMIFKDIETMNNGNNALQYLDIMAILNPDFIPTRLLKYIFKNYNKELADGLNLLHDYNLVTRCQNHYKMHPVVQEARIVSNNARFASQGCTKNYGLGLQTITLFSNGRPVELTFEEILDSICELITDTAINSENICELLNNIVKLHDQIPGNTSEKFLKFQNILADKLYKAGYYALASKVIRTVVDTRSTMQGPNHSLTTNAKVSLAIIYYIDGKYEDAKNLYIEVLNLKVEILGPDHSDTLNVKQYLAIVLRKQGKYNDAETLLNEILEKQIKLPGSEQPITLKVKHSLALVFQKQGKYNGAEELLNEVLRKWITLRGLEHPYTLKVKHSLAMVFKNQGKYNDAEVLLHEVLRKWIKLWGPEHPYTLKVKHSLAVVLQKQGRYNDAEKLFKEILDKQIEIRGPEHPDTLDLKHKLAIVFQNQGMHN